MKCAYGTKLCKLKMVSDILDHPVPEFWDFNEPVR